MTSVSVAALASVMHRAEPADEHQRWALYRAAMSDETTFGTLKDAVREETDEALGVSVVLHMLEELPIEDHAGWLAVVPEGKRTYCERRSREIGVLRRSEAGLLDLSEVSRGGADWADWLQLRLAETSNEAWALDVIAETGRTKRIRHMAKERAKGLARP